MSQTEEGGIATNEDSDMAPYAAFIEELSRLHGQFKLTEDGERVRTNDGSCLCPIVAVLQERGGSPPNTGGPWSNGFFSIYGKALGLSQRDSFEILKAADNYSDHNAKLRHAMLLAVGL